METLKGSTHDIALIIQRAHTINAFRPHIIVSISISAKSTDIYDDDYYDAGKLEPKKHKF